MKKLNADKRTYPINKCYCEECDKARGINQVANYSTIAAQSVHTRTQKSEYKSWKQQQDEDYYSDGGRIECYVYNHEVTIEFVADDNEWTIQAWTEDGYMVEERYCDTLEECRGYVDDMTDALEDEQAQSDSWYED